MNQAEQAKLAGRSKFLKRIAALLKRGNQQQARGQFSSAISSYQEALRLDPQNQEARSRIASAQNDMGQALVGLRVDGGAAASDLLMQIQSDTLGAEVLRPTLTETTALAPSA